MQTLGKGARPSWWHDIALRQITAVAQGITLFEDELAVTEFDRDRLEQIRSKRRGEMAQLLSCLYPEVTNISDAPIMQKGELRSRPEKFITGVVEEVDEIVVKTSGSTGLPTTIKHSDNYLIERAAQRLRMYRAYGIPYFPKVLRVVAKPGTPGISFDNIAGAAAGTIITVNASAINNSNSEYIFTALKDFSPQVIAGQPAEMVAFLEAAGERELELPNMKSALTQGDTLFPEVREKIELGLGVRVYDTYGLQEFGQVAYECPEASGMYHVNAEAVHVEVNDNREIIVSSLINRAMLLLRYPTGDRATLSQESCFCGRALPTLSNLEGRSRPLIRGTDGQGRQATELQKLVSKAVGELWQIFHPTQGQIVVVFPTVLDELRTQIAACEVAINSIYKVNVEWRESKLQAMLTEAGKLIRYPRDERRHDA